MVLVTEGSGQPKIGYCQHLKALALFSNLSVNEFNVCVGRGGASSLKIINYRLQMMFQSMPFFYPANRMEYFNGTKFTDKSFPADIHNIIGMQAVVSTNDYNAMLLQPHFGKVTPTTFNGYNSEPGMFFPFWTSDAYTFATSLVAVSHFENIVN
ncbi:hypothetical protein DPMN_101035 [Dreissena polymorpha]|uniref:Uncharacterized protein n=1 Tax=Dreissena polymorpha TaxID=45954 RepID=A0A9D4LI62_DREPO|nr:hypothetical protein DPMN_101035 [Dreissena polymorpha]